MGFPPGLEEAGRGRVGGSNRLTVRQMMGFGPSAEDVAAADAGATPAKPKPAARRKLGQKPSGAVSTEHLPKKSGYVLKKGPLKVRARRLSNLVVDHRSVSLSRARAQNILIVPCRADMAKTLVRIERGRALVLPLAYAGAHFLTGQRSAPPAAF